MSPQKQIVTLTHYTLEQLVDIITREVMAVYPSQQSCTTCGDNCRGQCVETNPMAARQLLAAGASRFSTRLGVGHIADDLASTIDHTLLKPQTTAAQIRQLCAEAREYGFASVCINPTWVPLAAQLLQGAKPVVCTVLGFPLGATLSEVKAYEAQQSIAYGASEVDMVINIGALKSKMVDAVRDDIAAVVQAAQGHTVKVIIETSLLNDEEKVEACVLAKAAGADFVKTSTGFGGGGATVADVALMRRVVGAGMGVKASGGIHNVEEAQAMLQAGATRIGASAGIKIVQGAQKIAAN